MNADEKVYVKVTLTNEEEGLAVTIKYKLSELPHFTQWKSMQSGDYVLGFEPGNCHVMGRAKARSDGSLKYVAPGETKNFKIEVSVNLL